MHGYDCYDYGARHSYTALGRFTTIDPLAEKYYGISPYALCAGNPVKYIDPDGRWVAATKVFVTAGAGMGPGLSVKGEVGLACDKYGATMFASGTGNCFVNQNLQEGSSSPRFFAGAYAGIGAGVDYSWNSDSYADYASSCSTTVPARSVSGSIGEDGAGLSVGLGLGLAFETSPTTSTVSLSMSYSEMGTATGIMSSDLGLMKISFDKNNPTTDEKGNAISYSGVATFSNGQTSVQYDVTCRAVNGEPSNQWETCTYTTNKQNK